MKNRGEEPESADQSTVDLFDEIDTTVVADASKESEPKPSISEFIENHPRAEAQLIREAEAMEFDMQEVYSALRRVQESYDAFEGAGRRPIIDHGTNYVAFELNGGDWYYLFKLIKREIENEEMEDYIARVVTKVMSEVTSENWHTHNSLPLILSESEVRDVLAYHKTTYDPTEWEPAF